MNSRFADAYSGRGFAHKAAGRYRAAIDDFSQAIRLDARFAVAYNNRADTYTEMGEPDRALADLGEAIKQDPSFGVAYANRGFALTMLGRHEEAGKNIDLAGRLGIDRNLMREKVEELRARLNRGASPSPG